ncbi:MAG: TIGR04013 family B12-binding domain/radical SAM domain-containing protein [Deferrisomatales bacterium]
MLALIRETPSNRFSVNALTGILDTCRIPWAALSDPGELAARAHRAARRGRRVLAVYSFMTPDLARVRSEVRTLLLRAPRAVAVAGGPHPSADPQGSLGAGFHHVFVGDAEETLPGFLEAGATGPAIWRAPDPPTAPLGRFPAFGAGRGGPVELARGCPFGCGFCSVGRRKVRFRPPEAVLAAGAALRAAGRRKIFFVTPDAFRYEGGLGALDDLLGRVRRLGLVPVLGTFPSEVRPEGATAEALEVLRRHCQNRTVLVGAQSGSDAVLARLRRGHTVADALRAARTIRRCGLRPRVDLIFGLPGESDAERRATVELARRLRREAGAQLHAHYYHPLPGTPLWGQAPAPLDEPTRRFLLDLRRAGAEDGAWPEQERLARRILDWAHRGWIQAPPGRPSGPAPAPVSP